MATGEEIRLRQELSHYQSLKSELLQCSEGKFIVIKGTAVAGLFDTFENAYIAGLQSFGSDTDFMVRRILQQESIFVLHA